jgi:hypothetical protein
MNFKIIVAVLLTLFYSATCEKQDFEDGYHKKAVKNKFKKVGKFDEENGTRKKRQINEFDYSPLHQKRCKFLNSNHQIHLKNKFIYLWYHIINIYNLTI